MKFLVVMEGIPAQPTMSPEQQLTLTKETWAWSKRLVETGKADFDYGFADHAGGLMGGCGIMNVSSLEELSENLATCPMFGMADVKVYPLVTREVSEKLLDGLIARLPK